MRWVQYGIVGARLHRRFETLVPVKDVDLLVLLILVENMLFRSTSKGLIFLVHWPIPLVLWVLELSCLVLAKSCIEVADRKRQRMVESQSWQKQYYGMRILL